VELSLIPINDDLPTVTPMPSNLPTPLPLFGAQIVWNSSSSSSSNSSSSSSPVSESESWGSGVHSKQKKPKHD